MSNFKTFVLTRLDKLVHLIKVYILPDSVQFDSYERMQKAWEKCKLTIESCNNLQELVSAGMLIRRFEKLYSRAFVLDHILLLDLYNEKLKNLNVGSKIDDLWYVANNPSVD